MEPCQPAAESWDMFSPPLIPRTWSSGAMGEEGGGHQQSQLGVGIVTQLCPLSRLQYRVGPGGCVSAPCPAARTGEAQGDPGLWG